MKIVRVLHADPPIHEAVQQTGRKDSGLSLILQLQRDRPLVLDRTVNSPWYQATGECIQREGKVSSSGWIDSQRTTARTL